TLVALSMGMMMGALVLAATIVSYVVDAWSQRKPIMVVLGTASSVLVGLTVGIPFGLAVTMIAPKESALSLLSLIGGVSVANLLKADDEANSQSSQRYRFLSPIAGGLFSALVAGILINSMLESAKLFALVTFGVMAQQRLLSGLGIEQVPENVPKILSVGIGFYARHFLAIGVCASAAMLLKLL
ncbi:MAG: hypothetical protein N2381_09760, partial [Armatimonadetes bacterium]|nr:hypothetical protein [Armatimonadota bacterium]